MSRIVGILGLSFGMSLIIWGIADAQWRDMEGFSRGTIYVPIVVGIGLIILWCGITGRWRKFALWCALGLLGQAVSLQLIEAGPLIHYQHYKPFERLLTDTHPLLLIFLIVQAALVGTGLGTRWRTIRPWIRRHYKAWQILGIGLVFFLSSAAVSRDIPGYIFELFFATFVQAVNLANIMLMVSALPEGALASLKESFGKLFGQPNGTEREQHGGVDRFAVSAAVCVTVVAAMLSIFVYGRHPHVPDEVIYLYHARYLANGALTVPAPPVPDAFSFYMIPYQSERWYSIFPPGWPAMLAVGFLFGVPWLVNPLLAGINVLLVYILLREIYSRRTARMVVLLLCFSPWYVFMSMNFMAHTFMLTCALGASLMVTWARKTGKAVWGLMGGCMVGMVSLVRPLDGVVIAGLLGLWVARVGSKRLKASTLTAYVLGVIMIGGLVLPYNKVLTGQATVFPLMAYYEKYFGPKTNALGFGPERGLDWPLDPFPGHSPLEALINASLNTFSVNIELFGWSTGSLIFILLLLVSGTLQRSDYLMLAVITATFGVYSLYWFSGGPDFGARYWYLMLVPLVVLTVRGIEFLEQKIGPEPADFSNKSTLVILALLLLSLFSIVNYFPWRAIDKYHNYLGMRPDIRYLAREYNFGRSLVLVRGNSHPDYQSAWTYNPLDFNADAPLYAWDHSPELRTRVLKAYSDRPVWFVNGPTITQGAFKVVAGPLSSDKLVQITPHGRQQ